MENQNQKIILVTRKTRLEELVIRFLTLSQARFYVESLGQDFGEYETEYLNYVRARETIIEYLHTLGRFQILEREYLPNFVFAEDDIVLALGQDGLVANIMKYLNGNPLIGINPDKSKYDGVLLPFSAKDISKILPEVMVANRQTKNVTIAQAKLNNGQVLFGVNDLFIGPKSHVSARYKIEFQGQTESQSSSGIIVSTGLGSTGWMKSVITGADAISGVGSNHDLIGMNWNTPELIFAVREPFPSVSSTTNLVFGRIYEGQNLTIASNMAQNGVIFSDGIEADFLEFNVGAIATVEKAAKSGVLVI